MCWTLDKSYLSLQWKGYSMILCKVLVYTIVRMEETCLVDTSSMYNKSSLTCNTISGVSYLLNWSLTVDMFIRGGHHTVLFAIVMHGVAFLRCFKVYIPYRFHTWTHKRIHNETVSGHHVSGPVRGLTNTSPISCAHANCLVVIEIAPDKTAWFLSSKAIIQHNLGMVSLSLSFLQS